jgi:transcriptional regulator with XRE-family HTH domain
MRAKRDWVIDPYVPRYIQEHRKDAGLTLKELGARLGCTKGTMSRYENQQRGIDLNVLAAIAEALGKGFNEMFSPPKPKGPPSVDVVVAIKATKKHIWTEEENQELISLIDAGVKRKHIATILGLTLDCVRKRAEKVRPPRLYNMRPVDSRFSRAQDGMLLKLYANRLARCPATSGAYS